MKHPLKKLPCLAAAALLVVSVCGCGGGGGAAGGAGGSLQSAGTGNYVLVERTSADVGPEGAALSWNSVYLEAALSKEKKVTITEKFYTSRRPTGVVGKIFDIQPDGLQFLPGTRLCLSAEGTGYSPSDLVVVTGPNLDVELDSRPESSRDRVCTELSHSSPYSLSRARDLEAAEYTIFGSLDAKEKYRYTVDQETIDHQLWGNSLQVDIKVYCDFQCMESGERKFIFVQGGQPGGGDGSFEPGDGDLYVIDDGTYPLWRDMDGVPWIRLKSTNGTVVGGIAYLLAAEYVNYFAGSGTTSKYISLLDPSQISVQRFFYRDGETSAYRYVEIERDESAMAAKIRVLVKVDGRPDRTFIIDRTTAEISKSWVSSIDGKHEVVASPGDDDYQDVNDEVLYYVQVLVGIEDTPDETAGNPWDDYPRYTPLHELFAVNVMDLLMGYGWNNLEMIESYYRDRLDLWRK